MSEYKKPTIVFAPGCFDHFDGTQEELDEMMAEINRMVETGEIFEKSVPIDMDEFVEEMNMTDDDFELLLNRKLH